VPRRAARGKEQNGGPREQGESEEPFQAVRIISFAEPGGWPEGRKCDEALRIPPPGRPKRLEESGRAGDRKGAMRFLA
jgi:hypothetical protein